MFKSSDIVAINFSDASIEALQLQKAGLHYKVLCWSRLRIPPDIIEDGKILSLEQLRQAVIKLLADAKPQSMKPKVVAFSIPESKVFSQTFSVPKNLKGEELAKIARQKGLEYVPVDEEFIVADFQTITSGENAEVFYAATYRNIVDDYVKLFDSIGIDSDFITMESVALASAVVEPKKETPTLILDIGARTTIASIVARGVVKESVNIQLAGNALTAKIAKKLNLQTEEAERKKLQLAEENGLAEFIPEAYQSLIDEIRMFANYYQKKYTARIDKVLLAGGSSASVETLNFFKSQIGQEVEIAKARSLFKIPQSKAESTTFMPVLGLALTAFQSKDELINFSPSKTKSERKKESRQAKKQKAPETKIEGKEVTVISQKKSVSVGRRLAFLGMLMLAFGVFALSWYMNSDRGAVPAEIKSQLNFKEINLTYNLSLTPDNPKAGSLSGSKVSNELSQTILLDETYWQRINRNMLNSNLYIDDTLQVYDYVTRDLANRVWSDNLQSLSAEYQTFNKYLVDRTLTSQVVSTIPSVEAFIPNTRQEMKISIGYEFLLVDYQQYQNLLSNAFSQNNDPLPSGQLNRKVSITPLPGGDYQISESIRY